ncbi:MAG: ornithine cyclodeaminase family protein [Actinomycetota bacterium]
MLVLTDDEVRSALTMPAAIASLARTFRELGSGVDMPTTRAQLSHPTGWMRILTASLPHVGVFGFKEFHLTRVAEEPQRAIVRYSVDLFDSATGEPIARLDAHHLTAVRTAATAAVALQAVAPAGAFSLGVIGSGSEARWQVEAFAAVLRLQNVSIFSPRQQSRERLAATLSDLLSVPAASVDSPEAVTRSADVLIAATNTAGRGPAVLGRWLHPGMHVSSIGSTTPRQREIDPDVFARADVVVVDSLDVLEESGDAIAAKQAGMLALENVLPLSTLVARRSDIPREPQSITLYKSIGSGLQDVCLAHAVVERASTLGIGHHVSASQHSKNVAAN